MEVIFKPDSIHQGAPYLWWNVRPPDNGKRLLLDGDGVPMEYPEHGLPLFLGAVSAPGNDSSPFHATVEFEGGLDPHMRITATLLELDVPKLTAFLDPAMTASADVEAEIGRLGVKKVAVHGPAYPSVALISERRGHVSPKKFLVACVYQARLAQPLVIPFSRTSPSAYRVVFEGVPDLSRPADDRLGQFYTQT